MNTTLRKLYEHESLNREQAFSLLLDVTSEKCNDATIASFLSVFLMRKLTLPELLGFQAAIMSCCRPLKLADGDTLDIVGTGGDGKNTFNISTAAAIVTAGAGIKVAKHGNYAGTSVCGSSDVLQYLGYRFTHDECQLNRQLDRANLCFLHAGIFHPGMRRVAATRKNMGMRTIFNMLGPVTNPANPSAQFLGVSTLSNMRLYQYLLQERAVKRFGIVHTLDGYDEISLTGSFKWIAPYGEQIIAPEDIGMRTVQQSALDGGRSIQEAAAILLAILKGKGSAAQNNVVLANSAFAIRCATPERSLNDCLELAKHSLHSGLALQSFLKLINDIQ